MDKDVQDVVTAVARKHTWALLYKQPVMATLASSWVVCSPKIAQRGNGLVGNDRLQLVSSTS
ncbi:MAG: hypothetical protein R3E31_07980 [Chloroflexota bacterium]